MSSIRLAAPPRVIRDTARADSCSVFFDIWDSQTGSRAKYLAGRSLQIEGLSCYIRHALPHVGVPYCQCCCKWGHPTTACRSPRVVCPVCWGPHQHENHCSLAQCCKGNSNANPLIPPTPEDEACPHVSLCINCRSASHPADSPKCRFWRHRFDAGWIVHQNQRLQDACVLEHVTLLTGEAGSRRKRSRAQKTPRGDAQRGG